MVETCRGRLMNKVCNVVAIEVANEVYDSERTIESEPANLVSYSCIP